MQPITSEQLKKLEKLAKVGDIGIANELNVLESKIEALEAIVPALREARDGYTPVKGVDYEDGIDGYTPVKGVDYFDGENYVLTEKDKKDIAKSITVPIVEKVIEKTETIIKETPIVTEKIIEKEVATLDEATIAYLEDEVKKAKLDTDAFNRALGIVDQRTSFLINKVNNLPTSGGVASVVAGTNVTVDNTDPRNPVVSASVTGGSGITRSVVVTTGNTILGAVADTDYVCIVNGAHTVTMPTAVGNTNQYTVKNNHSADITINTTSSQTIDGTTSIQIAPEDSVDMVSTGTNWVII